MKPITLPIAELKPALSGLGKVINSRASLPVLHHVKVERTADGWIALTGTDLDRFVTLRLEHPAEGPPMAVFIPFDQLASLTKNCGKDESLQIEDSNQGAVIRFTLAEGMGESKVKPMPAAEFPTTPRIKAESIPLPPELKKSIHEAMACASADNTRLVLNGTFIDASNPKANYVVATDGKHLYSANSFALPLKQSLLIPDHKFLGWKEFNADGQWQLKADDTNLQLSSRRWRFITRRITGTYPNWKNVLPNPEDAKTHLILDPAKLDALIKLVQRMPCHDERYQRIGLEWKGGQLFLLGKQTNTDPWLKVPVPDIKGEGPELTVFLDRRFLAKALGYGLNTLSIIDEITPLRFHAQGRQIIVMPLRPEGHQDPPPSKPAPAKPPLPPASPEPPPTENKTMITNPTSDDSAAAKTPLEEAIETTTQLRDKFQDGLNQLRELSLKLKLINREQRNNHREFNSVRSTLRSLQGVKL